MLDVLLLPVGSSGDVFPFFGLALELRRRGHTVRFAANGHYRRLVERHGFEFRETSPAERFEEAIRDPYLYRSGIEGLRTVVRLTALDMVHQYDAFASWSPSRTAVAIASPLAWGARAARDRLGIPLVTLQLAPGTMPSVHRPPKLIGFPMAGWYPASVKRALWRLYYFVSDRVAAPPVNEFRAERGLPPVRRIFGEWWNSPDRVLGLFPEWFAPPQPDWPAACRLAGFPLFDDGHDEPLPPEAVRFLEDGEPPVVVTPGTANRNARRFFAEAAGACGRLGRRAIYCTRFPDQLPERLPGNARAFEYLSFRALLPRAAALVHHGGIGTVAAAIAAGIPQLVMPMAYDQLDNLSRVEELGIGTGLGERRFRARAVARSLEALLASPGVLTRCREFAARIAAEDAIRRACDLVEEAARSGGRP